MLDSTSIFFGQKHPEFGFEDFNITKKISRLAKKHQRQCTNDCNGEGVVNGKFYRCDGTTPGTYIEEKKTIFTAETEKIEAKIKKLISEKPKFSVKFQGDPRGATVKLFYENDWVEL